MAKSLKVAVYGSLKKGFGNHYLLEECRFLGGDVIDGWEMYSFGPYPMIISGNGKIAVEIYEIGELELKNLDRLEGFPHFYDRTLVEIQTSAGYDLAWLYFGKPSQVEGMPRVNSGIWSRQMREAWV